MVDKRAFQRLMAVAERHGQVWTRRQAFACGLSKGQIDNLLRSGLWQIVHRGAFTWAGPSPSPLQCAHAASARPVAARWRATAVPPVCVWESAVRTGSATVDELDAFSRGAPPRVRQVRALVEPRSQSPLETLIRLPLRAARIDLQVQYPVLDTDGFPVAVLDLCDPVGKVALEADGAGPHAEPRALYQDRVRQNALERLGWRVARFTWYDARQRPHYVVSTVAALRSAPLVRRLSFAARHAGVVAANLKGRLGWVGAGS